MTMLIGERIRALREAKDLSQGDIEARCGLRSVHVSRVENGHTNPSLETLEKLARALNIPLYQFFYDETVPPDLPTVLRRNVTGENWGKTRKEVRFWTKLCQLLARMKKSDRQLLLAVAEKMARR